MHLHYIKGNLLDSNVNYICHQVNCQKVMGAGIAKQIADRWPQVKEEYQANNASLGHISMTLVGERQAVINMYAQYNCGTDKRYTDYEAFYSCLEKIHDATKDTSIIGFPYGIGCGLGGGDWDIIEKMIEKVLFDREVYVYYIDNNYVHSSEQHKAKIYCCYSQTDIGRNIDKFIQNNPNANILDFSVSGDELLWFLTIIYKE